MPGHAASWRVFGQDIIGNCSKYWANINNIPLNPANDQTFAVVKKVLDAVKQIFPDPYLHLGADELVKGCWRQDPSIAGFIANNTLGIRDADDLWGYFQQRLYTENIKNSSRVMVAWEELFLSLNSTQYTPDTATTVIQIWNKPGDMRRVVQAGFKGLLSGGYYLDRQQPVDLATRWLWVDVWRDMYTVDPMAAVIDIPGAGELVLGGEGAMWGEQVDPTNLIERIWPRMSAVAERLWSGPQVNDVEKAQTRLIHHRCYDFVKRGLNAGPIRPDFCPFVYDAQTIGPTDGEKSSINYLILVTVLLSICCVCLSVALVAVIIWVKVRTGATTTYENVNG